MANAYTYSNTAIQTTLSGSISNVALTITVGATTGFPVAYPYVLALDYGGPAEELVTVTAAAGTTLTIGARGFGGTSAQSHSLGAVVRHVYNAVDATDFRTHEAATAAVHGVAGTLVGTTDTQTLTNKTLTAPAISNPTITAGGSWAGSPTITGPTLNSASIPSPSITGTVSGSASYTTPTITSPTISGTVGGSATYTTPTLRDATGVNSAIGVTPLTVNAIASTTANLLDVQLNGTSRLNVSSVGRLTAAPASTATKGLYANAASGFAGNLLEGAVNAVAKFSVTETGNMTYVGSLTGGSASQFTVDASGNIVTTGNLTVSGVGAQQVAVKSATTGRASTTTLTADPHLALNLVANATYLLDGYLEYDGPFGPGTADIKFDWTLPVGATLTWSPFGLASNDTSQKLSASQGSATSVMTAGTYGTGGSHTVLRPGGYFTTAASAGAATLRWAQNVSNATATTMYVGSWFRIYRVS